MEHARWGVTLKVGETRTLSFTLGDAELRYWNAARVPLTPLALPTIAVFDSKTGRFLREWGANLFAMPHGISVDDHDNVWLTDLDDRDLMAVMHMVRRVATAQRRNGARWAAPVIRCNSTMRAARTSVISMFT